MTRTNLLVPSSLLVLATTALLGCGAEATPLNRGNGTNNTGTGGAFSATGGATAATGGFPSGTGGYPPTGTGGTPPAGTGGTPPAGTGGTPPTGSCNASGSYAAMQAGGYFDNGTWKGYAWTGTEDPSKGSTITPADYAGLAEDAAPCACGSVAADPAFGGVAMIGFNLNQDTAGGMEMPVTPTGNGITFAVANNQASTPLRLQIQAGTNTWCADISGQPSGQVPWSTFNATCWDNAGAAYAMEPITQIVFLIPGDSTAVRPFDFCVTNVAQE